MREYLLTLISVSVICGVVQTLAPDSVGDKLKKHVKLLSSLCVLCIILAPISALLRELQENGIELGEWVLEIETVGEKYEDVYLESIGKYTVAELEEMSEIKVAERFGMDRKIFDVNVVVIAENDSLVVDRAVLSLHKTIDKNDPRDISEYISALLKCECGIIYT